MKSINRLAMLLLLVGGGASPAYSAIIEDFDNPIGANGYVYFDTNATYDAIAGTDTGGSFAGNGNDNSWIVQSSSGITSDQGGTGYFDYSHTGAANNGGLIWGTITPLSVTPGTNYEFSFYLANNHTANPARISPVIDGVVLTDEFSATGVNSWQKFTYTWNSGVSTTVDLGLWNRVTTSTGNDFGLDTISFSPVPEPSSLALLVLGSLGMLGCMRQRKRAASRFH